MAFSLTWHPKLAWQADMGASKSWKRMVVM